MRFSWHLLCLLLFSVFSFAQDLPTQVLDEVVVADLKLKKYADGHKVNVLNDSTILNNGTLLTSLLHFNSHIYFKENGYGMVSSPAFRGTSASHTAVVWNGITINSQLTGQLDFNTINPFNYSSVSIRSGGGSVQYGTGAIGGSIHLNNDLAFTNHFENRVVLGYGSFNTQSINYHNSFATGKWSSNFGINYNSSDNDFKYLETNEQNTNGEFNHLNLNFNSGISLANNHVIKLFHQTFIGDRNLSGTLLAPGRSKFEDENFRTQVEWGHFGEKLITKLKVAHLHERFKYFENKNADNFTSSRVTTMLARYSVDLSLSKSFDINTFVEYANYSGAGDNIGTPRRNDVAIAGILKHKFSKKFRHNLSVRQDISSDFMSPVLFAWHGSYDASSWYKLQLNASRNFRMPTFNDLYWQPGGNLDLRTENSYQIDLGNQFSFKKISLNLNGYYIDSKDMIRWVPNNEGIWSPSNIDNVRVYGVEAELSYQYNFLTKHYLAFQSNYAYTVSEDKATNEQLIYVPFHRINGSIAYNYNTLGFFYQHLYNGSVQIIGGDLGSYQVANLGVHYQFKIRPRQQLKLGLTLNNVFNTYYENIAFRPMPNRNIQTQIQLNF
ncbi:TonB-dependent receptor [Croceivirga lutea]|uniref:TonB-dependent receptor plug domain-containing protein n=1 Tax=Croceivirga lutea TaxID=1775167 RepID=UPI00163A945B|nr:TonB-dependent receptor [Croceivirga lutea]GGG47464.1 TonB-dependent receptor [Croceivirga lutea]